MSVYDLNRILAPDAPPGCADDTHDAHYVPAPCQVACPVGTDAPSYIAYIWEGRLDKAFEAITATNPFSSICGRVCDAPCEPACRRTASDGPILIRNLKRYVMDSVGHRYDLPPVEVSREHSVGIVGAGPAGLVAAHDLAVAGYAVDVYEMSDRAGGMMVWGIPAFRLPPGIIQEDLDRLSRRCPGITLHFECALGTDVSLAELKERHDAVLLTIGAWWGKSMRIPGEQDPRVVDGVGFLRRVNAGERPELPETVVVIGGGDVAMDACRVARRLPGCRHVKVVYRRGPDEIPARRIELEGAVKEGIEFVYHTQQTGVHAEGNALSLQCVRTEPGEPDADGRARAVAVPGSEHAIACGLVIAAVGQRAANAELEGLGMLHGERVEADFDDMLTGDRQVFAAGDGAFGGSTIVMAMSHGQRAAYYIRARLEGREQPLPYRTPHRTRRVPVAQDLMWERYAPHEPAFLGVGDNPVAFPEIERTYDAETARREAARCYRCDAETGSADYAVHHREDVFSMARTVPRDTAKLRAMLARRLTSRDDPFPEDRPGTLDDMVFLPANLSRLVIDPYREACRVGTWLAGRLELPHPFLATGFDEAPEEVAGAVVAGLLASRCHYVGRRRLDPALPWFQVIDTATGTPRPDAEALLVAGADPIRAPTVDRARDGQLLGFVVHDVQHVPAALARALEQGHDLIVLDACGELGALGAELRAPPTLSLLRDTIAWLRGHKREEAIAVVVFGGVRSGTDAAKLIGLGADAIVLGTALALAAGGRISHQGQMEYSAGQSHEDRASGVQNIVKASVMEASMMARCTGKTNLYNLEPEDIRSITLASARAAGVALVGSH